MDINTESVGGLIAAAAIIGAAHTALSPAHYLPFAALAKDRGWGFSKTLGVTAFCGLGHMLSSILVGIAGVALGAGIAALHEFEESRGTVISWIFLGFALAYTAFGLKSAFGKNGHVHNDGSLHSGAACPCEHRGSIGAATTIGMLFIIFTFGPCEILIPLIMVPAAAFDWLGVIAVAAVFSLSTIVVMLGLVAALLGGMNLAGNAFSKLSKYGHLITGLILIICAILMFFHNHAHEDEDHIHTAQCAQTAAHAE